MKPAPFSYHAAPTARDAVTLLAELGDRARVLAGGQSLVPLMNFRLAQPSDLVDINPASELDFIRADDGEVWIGACARQAAVERSVDVATRAPLLVEALGLVAHEPIRHRGTVVGSLAHADPAAEVPAVALAMDAELETARPGAQRLIPAADFFTGPFSTALEPDELLTGVRFRRWPVGTGHAFVELKRAHGAFAIVGVATLVHLDGTQVDRAAIAVAGAGPTPVRAGEAERLLAGQVPEPELIAAAAAAAAERLDPASDVHGSGGYRKKLARALTGRAITLAIERARGGAR